MVKKRGKAGMNSTKNKSNEKEVNDMGTVMLEKEHFQCLRCNHIWQPRGDVEKPIACPGCHSPYWDKPRKNKIAQKVENEQQ